LLLEESFSLLFPTRLNKMNSQLIIYSGILLLSVFLASISQVMLKKAAMKEHTSLIKEYVNPLVITGYAILLICTLLTIFALKIVPLGLAAVLETTGYIYITVFGVYIFKENLSRRKILALSIIILGIVVFAFFG